MAVTPGCCRCVATVVRAGPVVPEVTELRASRDRRPAPPGLMVSLAEMAGAGGTAVTAVGCSASAVRAASVDGAALEVTVGMVSTERMPSSPVGPVVTAAMAVQAVQAVQAVRAVLVVRGAMRVAAGCWSCSTRMEPMGRVVSAAMAVRRGLQVTVATVGRAMPTIWTVDVVGMVAIRGRLAWVEPVARLVVAELAARRGPSECPAFRWWGLPVAAVMVARAWGPSQLVSPAVPVVRVVPVERSVTEAMVVPVAGALRPGGMAAPVVLAGPAGC